MDKLDIKILRELIEGQAASPLPPDVRRSFGVIGKKFHVSEDTIRNRIKRLQLKGFWQGWKLLINPNILGLSTIALFFDVLPPSSKDDSIRKFKLIQGVLVIVSYYGSSLAVILYHESEQSLRKQIELIQRISNTENMDHANIPFPECNINLSKTDWNIVRTLQKDLRKSYNAVSKELGLSSRTVRRRLATMIQERALFALGSLNPEVLQGAILVDLLVHYASPESRAEVDRKIISQLDDYLYYAGLWVGLGLFNLIIPNISKAQEILNWVKEEPGVRSARIELQQERIELYEVLNEQLEKKFAQILA